MRLSRLLVPAAVLPLALSACSATAPAVTTSPSVATTPAASDASVQPSASSEAPQPASASPSTQPGAASTTTPSGPPVAAATTTMLGSVLTDITACAGATSTTLMQPGQDPHDFALASNQVAELSRHKLIVANGLGLEGGLDSVLDNLKKDGVKVYEAAPDVQPLPMAEEEGHDDHGDEHADEHGHDHGGLDPHFFQDPNRMATAAANIGKQLAAATGDARYTACGTKVAGELKKVDADVRATLAAVPKGKRVLVTDHDALGYFAKAYDFKVAGVVIPGGSTKAEASSQQLQKVVRTVQDSGVKAIFSNTAVNPKTVQAIADEAGDVQVVPLFVDSVGPQGSGAETYAGMMRANAKAIADALK